MAVTFCKLCGNGHDGDHTLLSKHHVWDSKEARAVAFDNAFAMIGKVKQEINRLLAR